MLIITICHSLLEHGYMLYVKLHFEHKDTCKLNISSITKYFLHEINNIINKKIRSIRICLHNI